MEWVKTSEKLHPDKHGLKQHEEVPCIIIRKGRRMLRIWNCTHMVWDDEEGDDFYCEAHDVDYWAIIEGPKS